MYFINVATKTWNNSLISRTEKYRHFESVEGMFYNLCDKYYLTSINGFAVDLTRLPEDFRITRFVRDPRDLVISGYFYHKRGAEPWFRMKNPTNKYWEPINGNVPKDLAATMSYADYLESLTKEEGLKAEIEFRKHHLLAYREWPEDERILVLRYEDILGNEVAAFEKMADHLLVGSRNKAAMIKNAKKLAFNSNKKSKHIRNPKPQQWKEHFSTALNQSFMEEYEDILSRYQYL